MGEKEPEKRKEDRGNEVEERWNAWGREE